MEVALQAIIAFLAGAVLVETLTNILGESLVKIDKSLLAKIVGIVVSFYAKFNILTIVGLNYGWNGDPVMEYIGLAIGIVFSGLVLSRGSNGVHDFISKLQSAKELTQAKTEVANAEAQFLTIETDIDTDLR